MSRSMMHVHGTGEAISIEEAVRRHGGGDCYEVNCSMLIDGDFDSIRAESFNEVEAIGLGDLFLCHGEVKHAEIAGLRYGHCWVEDEIFVYDYSNGNEVVIPKVFYYSMGQISKVHRYDVDRARDWLRATMSWGPWELKTESGV